MKLGIFDSGLGGLLNTRAIRDAISDIDIVYFGDTLHLPYGNRSDAAVYAYTKRAMDYLFAKDCGLIVIACNTASAAALRRLQQEYLPNSPQWRGRNILGVVVPTLEATIDLNMHSLGLIATHSIVTSNVFSEELHKLDPSITLKSVATPLLVPLIEQGGLAWVDNVLESYLKPFREEPVQALILGCTHYPIIQDAIARHMPAETRLIAQNVILPGKLIDYLKRHPEYDSKISRTGSSEFFVSDLTDNYRDAAYQIYGGTVPLQLASDYADI